MRAIAPEPYPYHPAAVLEHSLRADMRTFVYANGETRRWQVFEVPWWSRDAQNKRVLVTPR